MLKGVLTFKAPQGESSPDDGVSIHGPDVKCRRCLWKHLDRVTCEAFPKGIPTPILLGKVDHSIPYYDPQAGADEQEEDQDGPLVFTDDNMASFTDLGY